MKRCKFLASGLAAGLLMACQPGPLPPIQQSPGSKPSPLSEQSPAPRPVPPGSLRPAGPDLVLPPPATALPVSGLPAQLAGLRFSAGNRFLNARGQITRLQVELLDPQGARIEARVPLEWSSSRPQDFAVDAEGQLQALVSNGFSVIVARIPGTSFETSATFNVAEGGGGAAGGGGGGGGGAPAPVNQAPVITSLISSLSEVIGGGALVRLNGEASDDGGPLNDSRFSWRCAPEPGCGLLQPASGREVYWQSPALSGSYTLTLTVSDGRLDTSQSLNLEVLAGSGNLVVNPS